MNRRGLGRFGIGVKTVLREPTTDHDGISICPECGHPIAQSLGSHEIAHPEVVAGADPASIGDVLVTHGWMCDEHPGYEVVTPTRVGRDDAATVLCAGWVSVRVRFDSGSARWVPTPRAEVAVAEEVETA